MTQQVITDPDVFIEQGARVSFEDITVDDYAHAVEIKDSGGNIVGTLLYVEGVSLKYLTSGDIDDLVDVMEDEIDVKDVAAVDESDIDLQ